MALELYNTFYRNINSSDTETATFSTTSPFPTPEELGFSNPGYYFIQWNRAQDGTGNYYYPGQSQTTGSLSGANYYAIWGDTETTYTTTESELSSIADAIRLKGGTSAALTYPTGFVSAINAISGGDTEVEDSLVTRTISGVYENSRVTKIGSHAFASCSSLTAVSFPNATTIDDYAFYHCSSLTTVSIPEATKIGISAFFGCGGLTTASFPSVTTIGTYAFYSCVSLTTASFPSAATIDTSAFYGCGGLTTISFSKVATINSSAFFNCGGLTTASFPSATAVGSGAFNNCYNITSISFPSAITIYSNAFQSCKSLTTASFPKATKIGNYAFRYCYNLISLYLSGTSVVTLSGSLAFSSTPIGGYSTSAGRYGSVYVPSSLLTSYKAATYWSLISTRIVGY